MTDSPLPAIVIRRHFFVIKECELFVSMATLCPFLLFFQPHSVHDQLAQSSMEFRPVAPGVVVMPGSVQIPQQVWQALLLRKTGNRVVGTPEIGHQHTVEKLTAQPL